MPPSKQDAADQIRLGVAGAGGRMGAEIIAAITAHSAATLAGVYETPAHPQMGQKIGDLHITTAAAIPADRLHALIDFTAPSAALSLAALCQQTNTALVVGGTGLTAEEKSRLQEFAEHLPLLLAPNMSVGVNALFTLAALAAKLLRAGALGGGYDMEIFEAHHRHKKDAPSGTALHLGEVLAQATDVELAAVAAFARHGQTPPRESEQIGFSVVRGGDIVGEHRAIFAGSGEQLEIIHRSTSRANYAAGAVRAAIFAARAKPGLYDMTAVLAAGNESVD